MASNELKSLDNLFDGKFLRIPDYQRGFAWRSNQLKDFWEDLENLEEGHIHYTGVITLEKVTQEMKDKRRRFWDDDYGAAESDEVYYIVDGQQRLTTSIILIKVILDKAKKDNINGFDNKRLDKYYEKYISEENLNGYKFYYFGYTADNPSYEFLKTKIYGEQSPFNDNKETLYTANLEKAKSYFENRIKELSKEELEIIFRKLIKYFKFNLYEISDDLDVFVAFETMNNRGKKLSNLELLKNRLIYLSTKFEDNDKDKLRDDINECWKTIYEYLGKNKDKPLDDDKFLKNHWIMYHDYSRKKGNDYIVDLLEDRYTVNRVIGEKLTIREIRDYVMSLKKSVEHWYYLFNPEQSNYDDKIKFLLDKLYRLNYGAFAPLLMAIFSRDNIYDIDEVSKLLKIMERYIFLIFKISQRRSNTGDSEFYAYARDYYFKKLEIDSIIGIKNDDDEKSTGIYWWIDKYMDLNQFKIYLSDKFKNRDGFYSWNGISYFLFEYELFLKSKNKNITSKINWSDYSESRKAQVSIEHILPQTIKYDCWKNILSGYSKEKYKYIYNSLGNLVPLSVAKNSALQNYCFDIKKNGKEGEMVGYKNGSYAEQEINIEPNWTTEEIKKRGLTLLTFLADYWDITELKDKEVQEKYLFLPLLTNP